MLPDICSVSCLREKYRQDRFDAHLATLQSVKSQFPDFQIGALCSGYRRSEIRKIKAMEIQVKAWDEPTHKYVKQNWMLERLYQQESLKSICLIDDDVLFEDDSVDLVAQMMREPSLMEAPCYYCVPKGLLLGMYLGRRPQAVAKAPLGACGWMLMVRSDLQVYYDGPLILQDGKALADDMAFRCLCAVAGQQVLLDNRIVMTTKIKENKSYVANHIDLRREYMDEQKVRIIDRFPYLLHKVERGRNKGKGFDLIQQPEKKKVSQLRFVWSTPYAQEMLRLGLLRRTNYGLELVPGNHDRLCRIFRDKKTEFRSRFGAEA